jgi:predicted MPP superfamily phosphohydrolase
MIAVYLAPIYLLVNGYLLLRMTKWLGAVHGILAKPLIQGLMIFLYCFAALAMVIAFFLPEGTFRRHMKILENYWLGVLLYTLMTVGTVDVFRIFLQMIFKTEASWLFTRRNHAVTGAVCLVFITVLCLLGASNARKIHTTEYEVTVFKKVKNRNSLKIVLAADLHLGYNIGCEMMEQMVEKINREQADLVVIAGDLFDNQYEALEKPDRMAEILKGIQSRYGTYACYGNHDIQEAILAGFTFGKADEKKVSHPKMDELLQKAEIHLLQEEGVLIDDSFYLYGRPDAERPGRGITKRKTPEEITATMDQKKPIIVMDHEPKELLELSKAGVDLDLGGHTHDGQLFPGNLLVRNIWENPCGYLKKGEMHSIVTSGVGLFGPYMRVGTTAEICSITVTFEANEKSGDYIREA